VKRAVFLDRDGTIIREVGYASRVEDLELLPGAAQALRRIGEAGYLRIVITNQSGVARGYFDAATVERLNEALRGMLAQHGADVESFAYCPHLPEIGGPCDCRKPAPGMLLGEAQRLGVDLSASWMVGDKAIDVEAGHRAGCRTALVRTGYGAGELGKLEGKGIAPDVVTDDLGTFAEYLLGSFNPK
jgi:D-glycero-D-manno-heptose 1,7-bisphosphate phosphatase